MVYNVRVLSPGLHQVVKQEYDALGRVFKTTQYASAVGPLANFDRATIEAAVNAVAAANDRKVQYVYDAVGRQRFVLQTDSNARWTVSESRYDVIGNLVESRRYDRYVTDALDRDSRRDEFARGQRAGDTRRAERTRLQRQHAEHAGQPPTHTLCVRYSEPACASRSMLWDPSRRTFTTPWATSSTTVRFAARPTLTQYTESAINAAVNHNDANNQVQHFAYDATDSSASPYK